MNNRGGKKRGQVTIFIIIAVLVVGAVILIYTMFPGIRTGGDLDTKNPSSFIQECLEEDIGDVIETISLQGGTYEPEFFILYQNNPISYICYTNENYKNCVVQEPTLKQQIESEIKLNIENSVTYCFNNLRESYIERGYDVGLQAGETSVELLPKRVVSTFDYVLTLTKGEREVHDSFSIVLNNNLYELISITKSIIEWEATFGNADPRIYMT